MVRKVDDSFTEAVNTVLTSHIPSPVGTSWTLELDAAGTQLEVEPAAPGFVDASSSVSSLGEMYSCQPNPSDGGATEYDQQWVANNMDAGSADDPCGCFARFVDTNNYYAGMIYRPAAPTDAALGKNVAGIKTILATANWGAAAGDFDGDTFIFKVRNSSPRLTLRWETGALEITSNDAALTGAGKCGICLGNVLVDTDDISTSTEWESYYWDDLTTPGTTRVYSIEPRPCRRARRC